MVLILVLSRSCYSGSKIQTDQHMSPGHSIRVRHHHALLSPLFVLFVHVALLGTLGSQRVFRTTGSQSARELGIINDIVFVFFLQQHRKCIVLFCYKPHVVYFFDVPVVTTALSCCSYKLSHANRKPRMITWRYPTDL